ncbi:hypothetical protein AB0F13_10870 [Streptomyces sp. NPDC026206]|uniref:hypothetical protein n=1 Tax=Streptomyces sp. NPDC026206 TaxID=3157089 RepID=UPI0034057930
MHDGADEQTDSRTLSAQRRDAELRSKVREVNERSGEGRATASSPVGCAECVELEAARRQAAAGGDRVRAEDATIAVRSHFRDAHLLPSGRNR